MPAAGGEAGGDYDGVALRARAGAAGEGRSGRGGEGARGFESMAAKVPAEAPWGQNKAGDVMRWRASLWRRGSARSAVAHWQKAVEIQGRVRI
jgi:hypothetical protein